MAFVQLNNAPVNSLNLATIKELTNAIGLVEKNPKTKALVLASSCRVFSAGLDLSEMHDATEGMYWRQVQEHNKKDLILSKLLLFLPFSPFLCLLSSSSLPPLEFMDEFWSAFQDLWIALYGTKLATVAAIAGDSVAGGCIISLACDTRLIASTAKIGLNEAAFGLVAPPWTAQMMIDVVGRRTAEKALSLGPYSALRRPCELA